MSLSLVGRYHFISEGRSWNPYLALGLGAQEHHDGTQTQPLALGFNKSRVGTNVLAHCSASASRRIWATQACAAKSASALTWMTAA